MKLRERENIVLRGIGASPGIAIASGFFLNRSMPSFIKSYVPEKDVEREVAKFLGAVESSKLQLSGIKETIQDKESDQYKILDVHLSILEDSMLIDSTVKLIKDFNFKAEWALNRVLEDLIESFQRIEDTYLKQRGDDIRQIGHRIFDNLSGKKVDSIQEVGEEVIIVAQDLSPADTAQMIDRPVKGFATDMGSRTSHTVIVARSLRIPAVVGLGNITNNFLPGVEYIIDGYEGLVIIAPDETTVYEYRKKLLRLEKKRVSMVKFSKLPAVTRDGRSFKIMANIELPHEAGKAIDMGADGIGLYRTEFIYLNRRALPTEEEQFEIYRSVVEKFPRLGVTIRTIDLGGDKFASHIDLAEEMNPAMGLRAIRFCLREKGIFKTQLRSILRASAYGKTRIMFPMISGVREVREAMAVVEEAKKELKMEGLKYDAGIELGIMIEIPSAALISDILAGMVDFFSIGTNDLIQYALAIDRVNEYVTYLYEPLHPAVIRMIHNIVISGHEKGIKVAMCGEMAGETQYLPVLLGLELDELSMTSDSIPFVKGIIRKSRFDDAKSFLQGIRSLETGLDVSVRLKEKFEELFPEEINAK